MTNKSLKRMLELMGNRNPIKENFSLSSIELQKKAPNGKIYGIVRENKKYFIKESVDGVNYDYINGVANKTKNQYSSYDDAVKRLNIMFEDFNRTYGIVENNDMLSSDVITEKKFVLKSKKKKAEPAVEEPATEEPATEEPATEEPATEEPATEEGGDEFDFGGEEGAEEEGGDEFDFGGEEGTEEGGEEGAEEEGGDEFDFGGEEEETTEEDDEDLDLEEDPIKDIQRMTGKLGQKIRDTEDLSSDTMKWVAKSVIAALDLENMDDTDKKDIIRAIKKRKNEGSDEELDFMDRNVDEDNPNIAEPGETIYVNRGENKYRLLVDDEESDYMAKYTKYGSKVKGRGLEMHDIDNIKSTLVRKLGGDRRFKVMGNEIEGSFGTVEINRDGYQLYVSNMVDYDEIPVEIKEKAMQDLSKPIVYSFTEVSDLANDIRELENLVSGEEDYMEYMDYDPETAEPEIETVPDTRPAPGTIPSPFSPPPYIEPGEEPSPKAKRNPNMESKYEDYMTCPACDGMYDDCDTCGGHGIMSRAEATGEVDEPFTMKEGGCQSYMYESGKKRGIIRESLVDKMETYEQEQAFMDVEEMAMKNGLKVGYCHKDKSSDPEEKTIYLELKKGDKVVGKVRINTDGDVEVGTMKNKSFTGQPVDSYSDFDEYLEEKDIFMKNSPAPAKPKEKEPQTVPDTRPAPGTTPSPFTPPPYIEPGEEPNPKAKFKSRKLY